MLEKLLLFFHKNEYVVPILAILGVLLLVVNAAIYFRYIAVQQRKGENFWAPQLFNILLIEIVLAFPLGVAMALALVADGTEITQEELRIIKPVTVCVPIFWIFVVLAAARRGQSRLNQKREREQNA